VLFLCLLGTVLAACQQAPAPLESGQAKEVLDRWNYNGKKLVEMAEDFPEDKYFSYRPHPDSRTFGEVLRHMAATNFRFIRQAQGREYDREEFKMENFKTKADVAALVKRSFEEGRQLLEQATDQQMVEPTKNPYGDHTNSGFAYWMEAVEHAAEHYGNLVVYYRANGLVPPVSRQSGS
ncbi:MAG: DinB family protein, partial [Terriglobia bacterium]